MSAMTETARQFFDACETGKGWDGCQGFCKENATFSAQTGALEGIDTLEGYCNWMRDLFTPVPDAHYDLKFFGADEERNTVTAVAVFHGTHTGEGGPVPATGKSVAADYAYVMVFDGAQISHMTKVWNDGISMQQFGWA
jgi:predicted ester cyclase